MVLWLGIAVIPCAIGGTLLAIAPALYKGSAIWVSWEAISAYILFLFTAICLAAAVRANFREQRLSRAGTTALDDNRVAAEKLAEMVKQRWNREAKARHLIGPDLITVSWQSDDTLPGHAMYAGSAVTGRMDQVKPIVDQFLALTPHRLLLVGEPGSGKTALSILMMLNLLSRRTEQPAVPVMLSLSSWDVEGGLVAWISRRIASEYRPADVTAADWGAAVDRLIEGNLIIPVLDGLDELAPGRRGEALRAINSGLGSGPMILACRREDYRTISHSSGPLGNAAASVALAVKPSAVARFLTTHSGSHSLETWITLVDEIEADPAGPLAGVLSRPLMISLLPGVYGSPETDPAELLDKHRFDSTEAIESRLYEGLLQSYDDRFHMSLGKGWRPDPAREWLRNLARHLDHSHLYDIVFWQLPHAVNRKQRLLIALCASLLGGIVAAEISPLIVGLAAGVASGLFGGALLSLLRRNHDGPNTRLPTTSGKVGSSFIRGNGPLHTVIFSGLAGLLAGMLVHFLVKAYLSPSAATSLACVAAVIAGLPIAIPGWQPMVVMKEHDSSATPAQQFRDERRNNVAFALAAVVALVIAVSVLGWFYGGLAVGLLLGTFAAIIVDRLSMAWWSYLLATLILSASGTFPFRLAEFLQDSYDYGLLRRVGGVYQFRHAGFQDYLAGVPGLTAQTAPSEQPRASALLFS